MIGDLEPPAEILHARLEDVAGRDVSRETFDRLCAYVERLTQESGRQNLVSAASLADIWERHIFDSAQLVRFEPFPGASWVDVGSGAGLPGVVIACLATGPLTLIEPRRLRAEFLQEAVAPLGVNATVVWGRVEKVAGRFDVITARAVARFARLLDISHHLSTRKSVWVIPKGRGAKSELAEAQRSWQGAFELERSVTDRDSYIVVGTGVRPR